MKNKKTHSLFYEKRLLFQNQNEKPGLLLAKKDTNQKKNTKNLN